MKTVCEKNKCTGCMACINMCSKNAIILKDQLKYFNAIIDEESCVLCNQCYHVCPQNHLPMLTKPKEWKEGWADDSIRARSSSGGVATAIMKAFINEGGCACSCLFENGEFVFKIIDNQESLGIFTGSKYVKSNPKMIYREIKNKLTEHQKLLFIGLPCQVSALKNYVGNQLTENLYTIDLICHGTPSSNLLDLFLKKYGTSLEKMKDIQFRQKTNFNIYSDYHSLVPKGMTDEYTIGFLNGIFYTENCYECRYARIDRIGDVTLGDSWGSELAQNERRKGVSLVLCQTKKGKQLLEWSDLQLKDVNLDKAISANRQLEHPSIKPAKRESFFYEIEKGRDFHDAMKKSCFNQIMKQNIKRILVKVGVISSEGRIVYNVLIRESDMAD